MSYNLVDTELTVKFLKIWVKHESSFILDIETFHLMFVCTKGGDVSIPLTFIGKGMFQESQRTICQFRILNPGNSVFLCVGERIRMSVTRKIFSSRKKERINPGEWLSSMCVTRSTVAKGVTVLTSVEHFVAGYERFR